MLMQTPSLRLAKQRRKKEILLSRAQGKDLNRIITSKCSSHDDDSTCTSSASSTCTSCTCSEWLVLLNCCYDSGVSGTLLVSALQEADLMRFVERVEMYAGRKSYSYVKAKSIEDSKYLFQGLNNKFISILGFVILCGFAVEIPFESFHLPPLQEPKMIEKSLSGSMIFSEFISIHEERELMDKVMSLTVQSPWETLNKRSVQHFGYRFDYPTNHIDTKALDQSLPEWSNELLSRATSAINQRTLQTLTLPPKSYFNQLTINRYIPGQGIAPHTDSPTCFASPILIISLESAIVMEFTTLLPHKENQEEMSRNAMQHDLHLDEQYEQDHHHLNLNDRGGGVVEVVLPPRSLFVMDGECRYRRMHGIRDRKIDVIDGLVVERGERISLTFRRVMVEA